MSAEFVALADLLRPRATSVSEESSTAPAPAHPNAAPDAPLAETAYDANAAALHEALRDARLFRARLADAFDTALDGALRELAAGVLARELRIAPCDLATIVRRVASSMPVVRVRVAPGAVLEGPGLAVVHDAELHDGDAIVELAGGAIDARLGVRLAAALEVLT